jgi:hypothetical protein
MRCNNILHNVPSSEKSSVSIKSVNPNYNSFSSYMYIVWWTYDLSFFFFVQLFPIEFRIDLLYIFRKIPVASAWASHIYTFVCINRSRLIYCRLLHKKQLVRKGDRDAKLTGANCIRWIYHRIESILRQGQSSAVFHLFATTYTLESPTAVWFIHPRRRGVFA